MANYNITVFKPYIFAVGDKIRIDGGPRGGDWEIVGLSERKVKLRCPVSEKELEVNNFCYYQETLDNTIWPIED